MAARIRTALAIVAGALCMTGVASANIAFNDAPPINEVQKKYFEWENQAGGLKCATKGAMAALYAEPNKCYLDLDKCKPGIDALQGKLDAGLLELFADMVVMGKDPAKQSFPNACPGDGPAFVHLLAIKGIGYAKATQHLPVLLKMVEKDRLKAAGQGIRSAVTEAIWWIGDKEKGAPALKDLVEYDTRNRDYKHDALLALGRWKSDVAFDYCAKALTAEKDKHLVESCIMYLGALGPRSKGTYKHMVRIMEKHEDTVLRAMATLGDKKAVKLLEEYIAEHDGQPWKQLIAQVSLMEMGKGKKYLPVIKLMLKGEKPMSEKKKAKLKKKKRKKKKKAKKAKYDEKVVQMTAMELVRLTDKKLGKKVNKALWAAVNFKGEKKRWKGRVYATIALAQRGDEKAIAKVAELLEDPKAKIRKAVMAAIGGRDHVPHANFMNRGLGVVASEKLLPAVIAYYESEPKEAEKVKAQRAYVSIRAMVDAKKLAQAKK